MFGRSDIQTESNGLRFNRAFSARWLFTLAVIAAIGVLCLGSVTDNAFAERGDTFLTQTPTPTPTPNCNSTSISPTNKNFPPGGGSDTVNVSANAACTWTATSNAGWITISSVSTNSGSGTVSYTVAANTGSTYRTGTMTIAGQTFTVIEDGQSATKKPLTIMKQGTGNGSVAASVGTITWNGKVATATYPANTPVVLTAESDNASRFVQWTGCDVATGNRCTLNITEAKGVSAEFKTGRKRVKKDFDGDGKSDILWKNAATGDVAIWLMNGTSKKATDFAGRGIPGNWRIKASEDFDGDGKSDMLWQNIDTGDVYVWIMNSVAQKSGAFVARGIPADWDIKLSEDFDGDGKSDVLWQDSGSGAVYIWLMDGASIASGGYVVRSMPQDWYIRGVGDFNGDGKADILWQSRDVGDVFCWLMDGTKMQTGSGFIVKRLQPEWQIKAAADYNGDGNSDIHLRNTATGRDVIWLMDGISIKGADFVRPKAGTTGPMMPMTERASGTDSWDMKSTGDYNGDGVNDMLWQDGSTGDVYMWTMDSSGSSYSGGYVDQGVPADWSIY
ncbi:MAG: FG-GAP-like repeat-containing protein [Candidatus Magnetobacterium sp. LHC-1]